MNYGYQNEYDFVELFNNKYLCEVDKNSQNFLKDLFEEIIDNDEQIKSWKNKANQKTDIFNQAINKTKIIVDMTDRFIIRGNNSDYDIDALICGRIDDYIWIKKHDIYDLVLSKRCLDFTSPHIACMTIGPKKRNLDGESKNPKDRYIVCLRWNFIKEDINNFKKNQI